MSDEVLKALDEQTQILKRIDEKLSAVCVTIIKAEQEVPEYMRRFTMYFHDIVHIQARYEELGLTMPPHLRSEIERASDRMKILLDRENNQGGTFYKIREEMEGAEGNKYKHFRRE
jgi:hypothetical protein